MTTAPPGQKISDLLAAGPTLSFEFFPPKTDEAERQLEKAIHELAPLRPVVRVGDLRRRRVDPRPHPRHRRAGQRQPAVPGHGPPHLRGPHPRPDHGAARRVRRRRHPQHPGPGRRPARRRQRPRRRLHLRHRAGRDGARPPRRLLRRRRRPPRAAPPLGRRPRGRPPLAGRQAGAWPTSPSRSSSSRSTTTCAWSTSWPCSAPRRRCCRASCRRAQRRVRADADGGHERLGRPGAAARAARARGRRRRGAAAPSGSRWRPTCRRACSTPAPRGCTSTPSTGRSRCCASSTSLGLRPKG